MTDTKELADKARLALKGARLLVLEEVGEQSPAALAVDEACELHDALYAHLFAEPKSPWDDPAFSLNGKPRETVSVNATRGFIDTAKL